tara:strand:+ start:746 stop:1000 length:255 start_codon:yes stop_codon:yes gene_type:complete
MCHFKKLMISALSTNPLRQIYDHSERSQITPYDKLSDILSQRYPIAQKITKTTAEHLFVFSVEDHFHYLCGFISNLTHVMIRHC